ncbi:MAG: CoA transferase [Pseudomonadales bacterium]|nr:CoA transferase [Pseudomonadales bacterium]
MAPLTGIKVVEMGVMIAVPAASETLAGLGAEVIKVEDTKRGDELRSFGSSRGGMSAWFANANAGKRGLSIDLASGEGKDILWKVLEDTDVFIQGFRSGVVGKLGFDYETVSSKLPRLIYCSSTGFGESGPYADLPAYDPVIQALTGWAGFQKVDGEPTLHKAMVSDKTAAVYNAQAILAALVQRGRTGEGCFIEASMLSSNIMYNWPDVMMHCSLLEEDGMHLPNLLASYRLYKCKGGYITVALGTDKQFRSFCETLDAAEHLDDERLQSAATRALNMQYVFSLIGDIAAGFDLATIVSRLREADVPVGPVLDPDEVANDEHVKARGLVEEREHPMLGKHLGAVHPASMFGEALNLSPAPMQGEHSREILTELGYDASSQETLIKRGVIKTFE